MATVENVSMAYSVVVPLVLTTAVALILTLMRLYVRIRMIKLVGWDDVFNVLAMVRTLFLPLQSNPVLLSQKSDDDDKSTQC